MNQIKKASVLFLCLFASLLCFAQVNQVGKVDSYKKIKGGMEGKDNGYIFVKLLPTKKLSDFL